jgi:hypothetical protein
MVLRLSGRRTVNTVSPPEREAEIAAFLEALAKVCGRKRGR